jgi:nucleoside-diphosphate-sugar epimerase
LSAPSAGIGAQKVCALTGAHGYVGSILYRALEGAGWEVVALSRRAVDGKNEIQWSLDSGEPIASVLKSHRVSALVHAAWDLGLVSGKDVERVNVGGSRRLIRQAREAGVKRIVFVSTISAFQGVRSLYGRSKLVVESGVESHGGIVIRPGLVYGSAGEGETGGMFGAMNRQLQKSSIVPVIGDGSYPQYLVHEDDLACAVLHALSIDEPLRVPVTVSHPHPWPLRLLLDSMARHLGRSPRFLNVPWPLVYSGLKVAETIGIKTGFRSDSVISLVSQNPAPEWNSGLLGVTPRAFDPAIYLPAARRNIELGPK